MIFRLTVLCVLGFAFASCAVDPRWGPPRTGLLEPLRWQYDELEPQSNLTGVIPVALRAGSH